MTNAFSAWTKFLYPRRRVYYHWGCGPVLVFQLLWEWIRFMLWITGIVVLSVVALILAVAWLFRKH